MIHVSAPGKLMIAGEYAVLHGHAALVAAVDRRARLTLETAGGQVDASTHDVKPAPLTHPLPAEAVAAREIAQARLGAVPGAMTLDVSRLRSDGQAQKLGLGSSAAAAVAAAAAVFVAHGRDLADPVVRAEVLDDAMAGHRRIAPNGSGADVAAATLGGIVRFVRPEGAAGDAFEATPASLPTNVGMRIVWTGAEARTSDLVARVDAWAAGDARSHDELIGRIGAAAVMLAGATDAQTVIAAAEAHGEAMAELGDRSGAPIVEERLREVMRAAMAAGGAAKPSGAGGGDVAIAFFACEDDSERFESACAETGFTMLALGLGEGGVAVD